MLKIHPWVEFETLRSQKSISESQKTHKDGPHLDHIYIDHNPFYMLKIIPKFEPQNSIIRPFIINKVSKNDFFQPKDKIDDFFDF